jgi:hypothetical protein
MRNLVRFVLVCAPVALMLIATSFVQPAAAQVGCAAIRCKSGFHCVQKGKAGKCVPDKKRYYRKHGCAAPLSAAAA